MAEETLPHACYEGRVFVGYIEHDDETGEETEKIAVMPCRQCFGGRREFVAAAEFLKNDEL